MPYQSRGSHHEKNHPPPPSPGRRLGAGMPESGPGRRNQQRDAVWPGRPGHHLRTQGRRVQPAPEKRQPIGLALGPARLRGPGQWLQGGVPPGERLQCQQRHPGAGPHVRPLGLRRPGRRLRRSAAGAPVGLRLRVGRRRLAVRHRLGPVFQQRQPGLQRRRLRRRRPRQQRGVLCHPAPGRLAGRAGLQLRIARRRGLRHRRARSRADRGPALQRRPGGGGADLRAAQSEFATAGQEDGRQPASGRFVRLRVDQAARHLRQPAQRQYRPFGGL
ncbi:Uncharacterised protein [Achromobacter xylosoxidans]|nr:Uncharacterised protein [Achromobacter xylosoxidans]